MKQFIKLLGIGTLILGIGYCSGAEESPNSIQIIARDTIYSKNELHLYKNRDYKLKFKNQGKTLHDWNVKGMPVKITNRNSGINHHSHMDDSVALHVASDGNSEAEISFRILKSGTYEYYCSVPGHKEAGMKGKILVH